MITINGKPYTGGAISGDNLEIIGEVKQTIFKTNEPKFKVGDRIYLHNPDKAEHGNAGVIVEIESYQGPTWLDKWEYRIHCDEGFFKGSKRFGIPERWAVPDVCKVCRRKEPSTVLGCCQWCKYPMCVLCSVSCFCKQCAADKVKTGQMNQQKIGQVINACIVVEAEGENEVLVRFAQRIMGILNGVGT